MWHLFPILSTWFVFVASGGGNWKAKSEEFRAAMRNARKIADAQARPAAPAWPRLLLWSPLCGCARRQTAPAVFSRAAANKDEAA